MNKSQRTYLDWLNGKIEEAGRNLNYYNGLGDSNERIIYERIKWASEHGALIASRVGFYQMLEQEREAAEKLKRDAREVTKTVEFEEYSKLLAIMRLISELDPQRLTNTHTGANILRNDYFLRGEPYQTAAINRELLLYHLMRFNRVALSQATEPGGLGAMFPHSLTDLQVKLLVILTKFLEAHEAEEVGDDPRQLFLDYTDLIMFGFYDGLDYVLGAEFFDELEKAGLIWVFREPVTKKGRTIFENATGFAITPLGRRLVVQLGLIPDEG